MGASEYNKKIKEMAEKAQAEKSATPFGNSNSDYYNLSVYQYLRDGENQSLSVSGARSSVFQDQMDQRGNIYTPSRSSPAPEGYTSDRGHSGGGRAIGYSPVTSSAEINPTAEDQERAANRAERMRIAEPEPSETVKVGTEAARNQQYAQAAVDWAEEQEANRRKAVAGVDYLGGYDKEQTNPEEEEAQRDLAARRATLQRAKWASELEYLESTAANDPMMSSYAASGSYTGYGNDVSQRLDPRYVSVDRPDTRSGVTPTTETDTFRDATEDEKNTYNYWLGKEKRGEAAAGTADRYLNLIQERLNERAAQRTYNEKGYGDLNTVGQIALKGAAGLSSGVADIGEAAMGIFLPNRVPSNSSTAYLSAYLKEDLHHKGVVPEIVGDLAETTGRMLPSIGAGLLTSGIGTLAGASAGAVSLASSIASNAVMGAGVYGQAYNEMRRQGYSNVESNLYATLNTASELFLEKLINGVAAKGVGTLTGKAIEDITKGVDSAVGRFFLTYGAEMLSEGVEEFTQDALDPLAKYIATFGDDLENVDWEQAAYSFLLGSLNAGVLNGASIVTGKAVNRGISLAQARELQKTQGGAAKAIETGQTYSADSVAYQIAQKLAAQGKVDANGDIKVSAWNLARLIEAEGAELTDQLTNDITNQLILKGYAPQDAQDTAEMLAAAVIAGDEFSEAQRAILEKDETISNVFADIIAGRNTTVNQRVEAYNQVMRYATARSAAPAVTETDKEKPAYTPKMTEEEEKAKLNKGVNARVELLHTLKDKAGDRTYGNLRVTSETELQERIRKAQSAEQSDTRIVSNRTVREALADKSKNGINLGIDEKTQNAVAIIMEDAVRNGFVSEEDAPIAAVEAVQYSVSGIEPSQWSDKVFAGSLPDTVKTAIYNVANKTTNTGRVIKAGKYTVARPANYSSLSNIQRASIDAVGTLVESGVVQADVRFFQSTKNDAGNMVLAEDVPGVGKKGARAPNGQYDAKTNTVWLDVNAGNNGEGVIMYTLWHEIAHQIAAANPELFGKMVKAVSEVAMENGIDVVSLTRQKMENDNLDYTAAAQDVVCDAMSRMFTEREENIRKLAEAVDRQDHGLYLKMKDFFRNVAKKLRAMYNSLKQGRQTAYSKQLDDLAKLAARSDRIADLWVAGVTDRTGVEENEVDSTEEAFSKWSLREVDPVEPTSGRWKRGSTFAEVKAAHPTLFELAADEAEVRNPTQIKGTVSSYRKIYNALKGDGFDGTILDASSGLGYGTEAGRTEFGYDVDDIEPFPDKKYKPKYTDYSTLDKQYDVVISNAVLNVIPQDLRDAMVVKIGELLAPGGRAFINVRGQDVKSAKSKVAIDEGGMEYFISDSGSYQKGFRQDELVAYLEDALGDGFTVTPTKSFGAVSAIVTKANAPAEAEGVKAEQQNGIPTENDSVEAVGVEIDEKTGSANPVQHSLRTWETSDYMKNLEEAAAELAKATGVSKEEAKQYIIDVNNIAKIIASDRQRYDYESAEGSPFVSNVEYGGSIDFSTICKKRLTYTGTLEAIQNAMPDHVLTAGEMLNIRAMMMDKGYEVACGLCYVEGSRVKVGEYAAKFLDTLKKSGAKYIPDMSEVNTIAGLDKLRKTHPEIFKQYTDFMNRLAQRKPKMFMRSTEYTREILDKFLGKPDEVKEKNRNGGLRIQSFSDFLIVHLLDSMQVITDMARVGLAGQAYTKVGDFARALGNTGLKINLSLIAKDVDENGKLVYDEVNGMKRAEAEELRNAYSKNVGTIIVVFTDEQLKAAMADPFIDYIIPFHRSQWNKKQYAMLGLPEGTKDYTSKQNERYAEPVLSASGKKLRPENRMPNDYWDFSKSGKYNAEAYLRWCAENNRIPKFSNLLVKNADGSYSLQPDGSTDGYWKLLIDFKMYDNDGNGSRQLPVKPVFNMAECERMLAEYHGDHRHFPVAQEIVDAFVAETKEREGQTVNRSTRDRTDEERTRDEAYMRAVKAGDVKEQERLVEEAAKAAGYTIKVYRGDSERHNVFDTNRGAGTTQYGPGTYFTDGIGLAQEWANERAAGNGAKKGYVGEYYIQNSDYFDDRSVDLDAPQWKRVEDILRGYGVKESDMRVARARGFTGIAFALQSVGMISKGNYATSDWANATIVNNILREAGYKGIVGEFYDCNQWVIFDTSEAKSADPVTYDDAGNVIPLSERFNAEEADIRYSLRDNLTEEERTRDEAYMRAVKAGDMNAAQRMVDEAAKKAMPNSKMRTPDGKLRRLYHGTNSREFYVFDGDMTGAASGDSGYFGRGFYFAYTYGEARYYGNRVMEAYLNLEKPFNFQEELGTIDGKRSHDYNGSRAVFIVNFTQKFPELAKKQTVVAHSKDGKTREISFDQFTRDFLEVYNSVTFETEKVPGGYGDEWLVTAGKHQESFTDENGQTHTWDEYDYETRAYDKTFAEDKAAHTLGYLEKTKYSYIKLPASAEVIMDTEFSKSLMGKGYDGVIQSEYGDEAVAFRQEQIKSADPVTYDDNGNVIPLSERFNAEEADIRYSQREITDVTKTKQFKRWFGDWENDPEHASKIVDDDGRPLVVYHGTDADFTVFDRSLGRPDMDIQGMFFSPDRDDAGGYGTKVGAYYLSIKNPADFMTGFNALKKFRGQNDAGIKARDYLISLGYDGVDNDGEEFIAFYPEQIKSATDNIGTFDESNQDVRYSRRDASLEEARKKTANARSRVKRTFGTLQETIALARAESPTAVLDPKQVKGVALRLANGDKTTALEIAAAYRRMHERMRSGEPYTWDEFREDAKKAADTIAEDAYSAMESAEYGPMTQNGQFSEAVTLLRNSHVSFSPEDKKELRAAFGKDWVRYVFGKIKVDKYVPGRSAQAKDVFADLLAVNPELAPADATERDGQQAAVNLVHLLNEMSGNVWGSDSKSTARNTENSAMMQEITEQAYSDIWDGYMDIASTLFAPKSDKVKAAAEKLRADVDAYRDAMRRVTTEALLEQGDRLREKYTERMKTRIAEIREGQKKKLLRQVEEARASERWSVAELRAADDIETAKEVSRVRQQYERRETMKRATQVRRKIKSIIADLTQSAKTPSERRFIPLPLLEAVERVAEIIDTTGEKQDSKVAQKRESDIDAVRKLSREYRRLSESGVYRDDYSEAYSKDISDLIDALEDSVGQVPIRNMPEERLNEAIDTLDVIASMIRFATQQIGRDEIITNYQAGQRIIDEMDAVAQYGLQTGKLADILREWTLNPMRAARELSGFNEDSELVRLFNELNEGARKADDFRMEALSPFDQLRADNAQAYEDAVSKPYDFGLVDVTGKKLKITKMQAMQLVMTWEREQANPDRAHLQQETIIPDIDYQRKGDRAGAMKNAQRIAPVTQGMIDTILKKLNSFDLYFMQEARRYYNEVSKNAINSVSATLQHKLTALEDEYIPYELDRDYIAKEPENLKVDATLMGSGMLKSVVANANQPIVMRGLDAVLAQSIDQTAKIYGIAIPVRNLQKAWNMRQTVEDGGRTAKSAISAAWNEGANKMIEKAIADVQAPRRGESFPLSDLVRGAFVKSTLASNLSVWMKQAASYPTAGSILSAKALSKGLKDYVKEDKEALYARIDEVAGAAHWKRRRGLAGPEVLDTRSSGWEKYTSSKLGKFSPMNWIQGMDVATTAALFCACEEELRMQGVSESDEGYKQKLSDLYNRVIEETQPVYDPLHRAEIAKTTNELARNIFMFQTQPLQNSGILRDATMELRAARKRYGKDSDQAKSAGAKFEKAVASQVAAQFTFTAFTLIGAALLHKMGRYEDDDKELTAESVLREFVTQFGENVFSAIVPVIGSMATSLADKIIGGSRYDVLSDSVVDKLNDTINAFAKLRKPTLEAFESVLFEILSYLGFPLKNAKNIIKGIRQNIEDIVEKFG